MNIDLSELRKRTVSAGEYVDGLEKPFKEGFLATKKTYQLQPEATNRLRKCVNEYMVVAFSAGWCKDCAKSIPVLALINEATGLEVRVFGGLKKDPLSHTSKWRIPPSPPEVETFKVDKIPVMIILDKEGKEIGRIVEAPKRWPALEQELCEIIKCQQ